MNHLLVVLLSVFFSFSLTTALVAPAVSRSSTTQPVTASWGCTSSSSCSRSNTEAAAVSSSSSRDAWVMMPATLVREKKAVTIGRPAVLDRQQPETQRKEQVEDLTRESKRQGHEAWEVRIYNDGLNTREHVARSLVQVTGMSEVSAYQTMMQAHQNGIAVVGRFLFEIAEMYQEALRTQGIVCDIVPVEEEK
jgi:ATP-dependent Clp protease adaptor protein ClpS